MRSRKRGVLGLLLYGSGLLSLILSPLVFLLALPLGSGMLSVVYPAVVVSSVVMIAEGSQYLQKK